MRWAPTPAVCGAVTAAAVLRDAAARVSGRAAAAPSSVASRRVRRCRWHWRLGGGAGGGWVAGVGSRDGEGKS